MITGFITDEATANAILQGVRDAAAANGQLNYWSCGKYQIFTGEHAGSWFMPAGEEILNVPLRKGVTPQSFPEFPQLIAALGGLDARVEIDPATLQDPEADLELAPEI